MMKLHGQELGPSGPINDAYTGASIGNSGSLSTEAIDHCLGNLKFACTCSQRSNLALSGMHGRKKPKLRSPIQLKLCDISYVFSLLNYQS